MIFALRCFQVASYLLAARSPGVFKPMLQNDMREKKEKEILITDLDTEAFTEFVQYIHLGKIPHADDGDHLAQMYQVAHRWTNQ